MKTYLRVTREITNPIRDKRAQYGNKSREAFTPGECVQVIANDQDFDGLSALYRSGSNEPWNLRRLPPLAEWTEPTSPTDLEWLDLEHPVHSGGFFLKELVKRGIVTRAHIETIYNDIT